VDDGAHALLSPNVSDDHLLRLVQVLHELKLLASRATEVLPSCGAYDRLDPGSESANLEASPGHMEGVSRDLQSGTFLISTIAPYGMLVIHVSDRAPVAVDKLCTSRVVD
jgi:hypothetical protein